MKSFDDMTSEKLEKKGQQYYKIGILGSIIGIIGLFLLYISILITLSVAGESGIASLFLLSIPKKYAYLNTIMIFSYIFISCGIISNRFFFNGLLMFALGRIAHNTEKE